jgi:hypothetical protein
MRKMHSFRRLHSQGETRPPVPAAQRLKRGARTARRGPRRMFHVKHGPGPGAIAPGFVPICARRGGRAIIAALVQGPAPGNLKG